MKKHKKKFQMPGSMILLFFVLIFVAVLTWFIPTSVKMERGPSIIMLLLMMPERSSKMLEHRQWGSGTYLWRPLKGLLKALMSAFPSSFPGHFWRS